MLRKKQGRVSVGQVGHEHLTSIGEASASLGLISTLVFSLCIGSAMENVDRDSHNWLALFLTMGIAFSTYAMTFSLLEYYYAQTLKGVDHFMGTTAKVGATKEDAPLLDAEAGASSEPNRETSHQALMHEVEDAFATFNDMRMWARNCVWCSVMSTLAATITRINPFVELEEGVDADDSMKTALFFAVVLVAFASAFLSGFRSRDIIAYICVSVFGLIASLLCFFVLHPELRIGKITASIFLLGGIISIPMTVSSFRSIYKPMIEMHIDIH